MLTHSASKPSVKMCAYCALTSCAACLASTATAHPQVLVFLNLCACLLASFCVFLYLLICWFCFVLSLGFGFVFVPMFYTKCHFYLPSVRPTLQCCHPIDQGRSVCLSCASKHRLVEVPVDRGLALRCTSSPKSLNVRYPSVAHDSDFSVMTHFFTEFSGSARSFEIFDAEDVSLWVDALPVSHVYATISPPFPAICSFNTVNSTHSSFRFLPFSTCAVLLLLLLLLLLRLRLLLIFSFFFFFSFGL
jgi:hypothetical protein